MNRLSLYLSRTGRNHKGSTTRFLLLSLSTMAALLLTTLNVNADDEALYGPKAPPGSAFIRIFNSSQAAMLTASIGSKTLTAEGVYSASEYQFLPAGEYTLNLKQSQQPLVLEAGHYYTAYLNKSGAISTIEGQAFSQRKKALIAFYNLTDAPLTLKTDNGKGTVIKGVDSNNSGFREVNAVKISLAVFNEQKKIASASPIALKRGEIFNLFAISQPNAHPSLVWVQE
ncbi:alginate O-acetyltransferase AlgF [Alkalimarinus alittae]|uniref:Alginate biosynthesis protein AlgF n=1 Tax=Alkalimarinus alittae TaxID=2961619 RepID=A0ABY6N2I7_9ALTE|nr:alginate O-acetyltransferase AlgF [Alkalimarinus alittae]UZE96306.1 alginate O-acetyltransferase AlgF [Alkalimarinus alittae]